jgi:hypothetical protein
VSERSEFLTEEQSARYTELLNKFDSKKRLTIEEDNELEDLMALDEQSYQTPEYKAFAAEMDANLREIMKASIG